MAKEQKIKVALDDVTRNGRTVSVLILGKQEIGYIESEGDKFAAYLAGNTTANRFKNIDDAVNFLISEYHLHHS
ncbi:DUF2969 domain-containing protein [Lacticaseibacillus saniviri]|uniref:DUF2969 domain-containing protein n=1 Tax=Lacticaseibacillus saniviri TaxID=931533 RepID=UPI001EE0D18C|nr:DUF2969 domain-containing protein [Lacticaseibacillus saniviri]MCG4282657.1 DUF2969 domain-containing protein [Lacticaseibacillus saniviri]